MLNVPLVAPVRPVLDPLNVYPVPALLIDSPLKDATPLTTVIMAVPLNVPVPGLVPMATVT